MRFYKIMALIDLDKTTIKLPLAIKMTLGALAFAGGVWRIESSMSDLKDSQDALRKEIIYNYTIEIMKINNRIDLLEAKKFVQRREFKRDTISINNYKVTQNSRTNRSRDKQERHPQVCMVIPRQPEFKRYKFNIKKLVA